MKKIVFVILIMLVIPYLHSYNVSGGSNDKILELINGVSEEELYHYDKTIQDFGPHPTGSEECNAVGEFIYNEFIRYGLNTTYHEWRMKGLEGKNVIATIPGETNFTVILSAHYDSVDVSPGADDDGSGTSCLLMAAKVLSNHTFRHTIKLIAFSGEENGLYGSSVYAREAYMKGEKILADIQLDGVGHAVSREGGGTIRLSTNGESTWITDMAQNMIDNYGNYIGLKILRQRDFAGSDHQSFLNYGYEGVFFLEYEFNPYYHSPQDTIEHVNMSYLAKVCKLAIATLSGVADKDVNIFTRIVKPERGAIYFGDRKIMELNSYRTIVFGRIRVGVEITSGEKIRRVDFYFDGEYRGTDEENPYEYEYGNIAFFKHNIRAVAHGETNEDGNEVEMTVFNIIPRYWLS